ncbi:unnamed protein product [Trichobilharzia regenti]|nr:unnamed protein product [Trichobilharzia regenti]
MTGGKWRQFFRCYQCLFEIPISIVKSSNENININADCDDENTPEVKSNQSHEAKYLITPFSKVSK